MFVFHFLDWCSKQCFLVHFRASLSVFFGMVWDLKLYDVTVCKRRLGSNRFRIEMYVMSSFSKKE